MAESLGARYLTTILGLSFVIHQMGSVLGAWSGGMIFDAFGSYDLAWRVGMLIGIIAGVVQIVFGGPARQKGGMRPVLAAAIGSGYEYAGITQAHELNYREQASAAARRGRDLGPWPGLVPKQHTKPAQP